MLSATALSREYSKDKVLASMHLLHEPVASTVARTPSPAPETSLPPLETIDARKVLRVGFLPDALPYAFFNKDGGLVGFDIELAHRLARQMGVTLAFVPVDRTRMAEQLAEGYCDLVMSGVVMTAERARDILFSDTYLDETVAFVVPDDQREQYVSWDEIRARNPLTIAVSDVPYYVEKLREMLPRAHVEVYQDLAAALRTGRPPRRRDGAPRRARVGVDPDVSGVLGRRSGPRPDQGAARLSDRQARRGAGAVREHVDWIEAQRRHD